MKNLNRKYLYVTYTKYEQFFVGYVIYVGGVSRLFVLFKLISDYIISSLVEVYV